MADYDDFGYVDDEPAAQPKKVLTLGQDNIGQVFARVVGDIRRQIGDDDTVVDLELNFKSLVAKKGGIPIVAPKKSESAMEIRLATRIRKA